MGGGCITPPYTQEKVGKPSFTKSGLKADQNYIKRNRMPFQKNGKRDYKREAQWEKTKKRSRLKDRVMRVQARRDALKEGKVKKHDGRQLDHKTPITKGGSNARSNLRGVSAASNMSFSRNRDGSLKSQKSKRERSR
jgi:hypothetical protein